MNFNGNTAHPCVDCGVLSWLTTSRLMQIGKRQRWEHYCWQCAIKRGIV